MDNIKNRKDIESTKELHQKLESRRFDVITLDELQEEITSAVYLALIHNKSHIYLSNTNANFIEIDEDETPRKLKKSGPLKNIMVEIKIYLDNGESQ